MRRNIFLITLFLLTFLKFNPVYSEECDLEFQIGESISSVTEMLGEPDIDKNIELIDMNPSAKKQIIGLQQQILKIGVQIIIRRKLKLEFTL